MAIVLALVFFALDWVGTDYAYLAAYTVLQYVVLATAWNILGGYAGYVNFASAAFFAVGVYTSVIVYKTVKLPLIATMPLAAVAAGLLGLGVGYLTLRLRGTFFSIATLALSVVMEHARRQLGLCRRLTRRLRACGRRRSISSGPTPAISASSC